MYKCADCCEEYYQRLLKEEAKNWIKENGGKTMEQLQVEAANEVEVSIKKSSTKDGGIGYDVKVRYNGKITKEELKRIADTAAEIAKQTAARV